ncbi:flavin reductase family protein [Staphylococcus simulans]|nr:flavin reductase family protein [Staphylococcus simulans]
MNEKGDMSMYINPKDLETGNMYKMLIGTVTPRPIAFVTSQDEKGNVNAAPFAFFNVVCPEPPMLMISVGKDNGELKDTSANILSTKEFVVHIVDEDIVKDVVKTGDNYEADVNELDMTDLTTTDSKVVNVPSVKEAKVRYECELVHHLELGDEQKGTDMLVGQIKSIYIDDEIYDVDKAYVDVEKLNPITRVVGSHYVRIGEPVEDLLDK